MTDLRKRMLENMQLYSFSPRTQEAYIYTIERITRYFKKSPDKITHEEIRKYFLHLKNDRKYARATTTIHLCGIKFFYEKTLKKTFDVFNIIRPPRENKLPVVLSKEEVQRVLKNIRVLRHRACLTLIYSCGLRLREATHIKVDQIDSQRMLINVKYGKGTVDRYVPLPEVTLELLRRHYKTHRNPFFVFPAPGRGGIWEPNSKIPLPDTSVQTVFKKSLRECKINKDAHVHTLRHSYATHLLENGTDIRIIKEYLGHKYLEATLVYTHLTPLIKEDVYDRINAMMNDLL